jgi:uncharacterized protein YdhG (YjbR/CyaY superfamily)
MPAKDPDAYLAALSADKRASLEKVRKAIRAAAPDAEEAMSYGMPAFILGKPIAGYSAGANHCAYWPMSGAITAAMLKELAAYEVSKGGFRFPIGKPPPAALIKKLVTGRLAEINGAAKPAKKASDDAGALIKDHPLKKDIDAVRRIIAGVSPSIEEGVKWNAPSFRATEWFATVNLRAKDKVQIILHLGAKKRAGQKPFKIADPNGLLAWLAPDRALVTLGAGRAITANRKALEAIVRAWLKHV